VDETYIKIKRQWRYLYRAVDSAGNTLDFLLIAKRDARAAKRFFYKTLKATQALLNSGMFLLNLERKHRPSKHKFILRISNAATHNQQPRVVTVDKNSAYPKAIAELKAKQVFPQAVKLRQRRYLNNIVEQDHRFIKRLVKPGMGFGSFNTARRTLKGYEVIHMMRKGQVQGVARGAVEERVKFIEQVFGVAT